jgi:hypothetical protein
VAVGQNLGLHSKKTSAPKGALEPGLNAALKRCSTQNYCSTQKLNVVG